jgi:hypothetical protein
LFAAFGAAVVGAAPWPSSGAVDQAPAGLSLRQGHLQSVEKGIEEITNSSSL